MIASRSANLVAAAVLAATLSACGGGGSSSAPPVPSAGATIGAAAGGPRATASTPTLAMQWDDALLAAVRIAKPPPTVVARSLAVLHTAMYDAWAAYDPTAVGTRLGGALRRPAGEATYANKTRAISYAAYRALVDLFPAQRSVFDAQMAQLGADPADGSTDRTTPQGIGNVAAAALLSYRHADGSNQLGGYADTTGFTPVNGPLDVAQPLDPATVADPSKWSPLIVPAAGGGTVTQRFSTPQFARVTPFALPAPAALRPPPPPPYGSAQLAAEAQELVALQAANDDRTKAIAGYWADGPNSELPPGHWCLFADVVSRRDGHLLDDDVKLLFVETNALLDAAIAAWDAKTFYDNARPVQIVRLAYRGQTVMGYRGPGQGIGPVRGESWMPYQEATVVTPPFGEYVSGHSTFSAAAAEILKRWTGSDTFVQGVTIAPGSSKIEPGFAPSAPVTLSWTSFSQAADEAGYSRRYGGIHFASGDLAGRSLGRAVAALAWDKAQSYFNGTATPAP